MPISNIGDDFAVDMADIFYSRLLRHNKHLLWISPSSLPDLGGAEMDNNHDVAMQGGSLTGMTNAKSKNDAAASSGGNLHLCNPGAYRSVCIELQVDNLAVATIIQASKLEEMEGGASMDIAQSMDSGGDTGNGTAPASDDMAPMNAFRLLKVLVTEWLKDVTTESNVYADYLLLHCYRWLCSSSSRLYDPALHRMVQVLPSHILKYKCSLILQLFLL
jgi:DNA polymerase epsilon subunit 1